MTLEKSSPARNKRHCRDSSAPSEITTYIVDTHSRHARRFRKPRHCQCCRHAGPSRHPRHSRASRHPGNSRRCKHPWQCRHRRHYRHSRHPCRCRGPRQCSGSQTLQTLQMLADSGYAAGSADTAGTVDFWTARDCRRYGQCQPPGHGRHSTHDGESKHCRHARD